MDGSVLVLTVSSFLCAGISAVSGAAGGVILLGIMQWYMTPLELLPLHGVIQWASNGSRALLAIRETNWRLVAEFFVGAVGGTVVGAGFLSQIPPHTIPVFIGVMILATTLLPLPRRRVAIPGRFVAIGVIQGTAGMLTGAAGPLATASLQRDGMPREQIVITTAAMMAFLNAMKTVMFMRLGVSLGHYGALLGLTVAASFAGTWIGTLLRGRIPDRQFHVMLKFLLVGIGVEMIFS